MPHPLIEDTATADTAGLDAMNISQVRARARWQEEMGQATLPIKYAKTSALLLGWEPDSDDTGVADELEKLKNVMLEHYNFDVQLELMNCKTHPQQQAFKHLSSFVADHSQPRTLLIVYYAGHGFSSGKGGSRIALSGKSFHRDEDKLAYSIEWDDVERTLSTTPSDVLVIFDCCHAGLLCRSAKEGLLNPNRSFQYLGACESTQRTHRAGLQSFTSAVTWALEKLASEPSFHVTKLVKTVEEHVHFPPDQKPVLFGGRFDPVAENICLAPMRGTEAKEDSAKPTMRIRHTPPTKGVLELRLHFPEDVTEDDIVDSSRVLKACMSRAPWRCHDITFIDMYSLDSTALVRRAAWKWREAVRVPSRPTTHDAMETSNSETGSEPHAVWLDHGLSMGACKDLVKYWAAPISAALGVHWTLLSLVFAARHWFG